MGIIAKQAYFISPPVVTSGLISYVNVRDNLSYKPGSQTILDIAGPGNYGTLAAGVSYTPNYGGALYFNGTTSAYIDIFNSTTSGISLGSTYTLDLWIYPQTLIDAFNWISSTPADYYPFHLNLSDGTNIQNTIGATLVSSNISPRIQPQTWINIVLTRVDTVINHYVNTVYVGGDDISQWGPTPFTFGRIGNNSPQYTGTDTGYLSSVKIYNRILNYTEMMQNYNAHKAVFGLL